MIDTIRKRMGLTDEKSGGSEDDMDAEISDFDDDEMDGGGMNLLDMMNNLEKKEENVEIQKEIRAENLHQVDDESEVLTMDDILAPLEGEFQSVQKDLVSIQKTVALPEVVGSVKAARAERELGYETAKKDVTKWIPQVKANREAEQLVFGDATDKDGVTTKSLVSDFKASTDFEKELQEAIDASGVTEKKMREDGGKKGLPMDESLRKSQETNQIKRLKMLLARDQKKAQRVKKIKSKTYKRLKRKTDKRQHDKLLERLEEDNPEMAEELKKELEKKQAKMRLQRHSNARKKWALQAARFGGRDVAQSISKAAQMEADEKAALRKATKGKKKDESSDEEGDDLDVSGDDLDDTIAKAKKLAEAEMVGSDDDGTQEKGLLGLKFMREAIMKKREDAKEEAKKLLSDLQHTHPEEESGDEAHSGDEDDDEEKEKEESSAIPDGPPSFTAEELEAAQASLAKKTGGGNATAVRTSGPVTVVPTEIVSRPSVVSTATPSSSSTVLPGGKSKKLTHESDSEGESEGSESGDESDSEGGVQQKMTPDEIFKSLDLPQSSHDQIKACFAGGKQEEEFVQEQEDRHKKKEEKLLEAEDADFLPGWGGWCGDGITSKRKRPQREFTPLQEKAKKVQKFEGTDTKIMKYAIESVPHPFQSQKQYEESLRMPTGKEWNTTAVHKKKVLPRIITKAGAVIQPLQFAKHLPQQERDNLIDAWTAKKPLKSKARM